MHTHIGSQHILRKLAVCITFHYTQQRIEYLAKVCDSLVGMAPEIHLTIVTNSEVESEITSIKNLVNTEKIKLEFLVPKALGHPFLLTWSHLNAFRQQFTDESFTHFLYLEDDIYLTQSNISYWLEAREKLRTYGFYPSFLRRELNMENGSWYSSDVLSRMSYYDCPVLDLGTEGKFISIVHPYQGMYLYDRELMNEHLSGPSSNPDFEHNNTGLFSMQGPYIREKASLGLTYVSIPKGFRSRNLLPFNGISNQVEEYSMIHHLPNNYANDPALPAGKIPVHKLFIPKSVATYVKKRLKVAFSSLFSTFLSLKT